MITDTHSATGGPGTLANSVKHVTVCICTYKRPELLQKLLHELELQETDNLFTFSIVIVDNDRLRSANSTVDSFAAGSKVSLKYLVEPQNNIALARNRTIANSTGDFIAFIDDDEFPTKRWLVSLFNLCESGAADGVLGPVLPYFDQPVPEWLLNGKFFDRPRHPTGFVLGWSLTRTGNVLLRRSLFENVPEPFHPQCIEGSDQEYFKRMIQAGYTFVWCDEAVVYEVVPPARWRRSFLIRRAFYRGVFSIRNHGLPLKLVATSMVAAPVFALVSAVAVLFGQAAFMKYFFKLSYHAGRLLAAFGFNPIDRPYVSQ